MEEPSASQQIVNEALALLEAKDFNAALEKIKALEEVEPNYCHYFKARVDFRRKNNGSALAHLIKITDADSELLPKVHTLAQNIIPKLVRQQIRRALQLFDEGEYVKSKQIINSLSVAKKEPQFCNFMLGKIAQQENNLLLTVRHLAQVTNIKEEHSVVTHDLYAPAQKILADLLNEQAEIARAAIKVRDFTAAKTAILIIEACGTESAFCNYVKAEIANREGHTSSVLTYLALAAEAANSNKNKSLISFDTNTAVQNMLVGLVAGQLQTLSARRIPPLSTDSQSAFEEFSIDEESDQQTETLKELLEPFVKVTHSKDLGICFDFSDNLSLESQLRILDNLKTLYADAIRQQHESSLSPITLYGFEFEAQEQFDWYILREQYFIKAQIAAKQGLLTQSYAYYTEAFSTGVYKKEFAHLRVFYVDGNKGWHEIFIENKFTHEQCFEILQSMYLNRLIDLDTYLRYLASLSNLIDPHQPNAAPPVANSNSEPAPEAQRPPLSPENSRLMDKIEKRILLYCEEFNKEATIQNFTKTEKYRGGPEVEKTRQLVCGEDYKAFSKHYFELAWNLSRFKVFNAVAVFFAVFAFLPALVHKKYQLSEFRRKKRSADEITKDNAALNERRTELQKNHVKKARYKDSVATSKRHFLLPPPALAKKEQAAADAQLAAEQVGRASAMQLPKVIRSSGTGL